MLQFVGVNVFRTSPNFRPYREQRGLGPLAYLDMYIHSMSVCRRIKREVMWHRIANHRSPDWQVFVFPRIPARVQVEDREEEMFSLLKP